MTPMWSTTLALIGGVALFGSGYLAGHLAPMPWLRPAEATAPAATATPPASATPAPTASPTLLPSPTPRPSVTPFPTPTQRFVPRQPTRVPTLPAATEKETQDAFAALSEVWDLLHADSIQRPLDDVRLVRGAIKGMVRALNDTFSGYNDPEEYRRLTEELSGEYEGIGIEVGDRDGRIVIIAPMPGSPAEQAGLRAGDQLLRIDDQSVLGLSAGDLGGLVRGPAGTTVRLTVQRVGFSAPLEIAVTRARIVTPQVETRDLSTEAQAEGLAYIRVGSFGQRSAQELRESLRQIMAGTPRGLILDLRGNPGGSLIAAIDITSQFIGDGVVMLQEDADGNRTSYPARAGGLATGIPLVVLVDGSSASASEIVAGAVQDRGRGTLIGETTFGKGTVQDWRRLRNDQGGLRLTTSRWLTPRGTWVHGQGVTPDIQIPRSADDRAAGRDPQLERAILYLVATAR